MSYRSGVLSGFIAAMLLAGGAFLGWRMLAPAADSSKAAAPAIPATVPKPLKEDQINTVILTAEGEQRLALQLAAVERRSMPRFHTYGGEVAIPPGRAVIVSSPLSGILRGSIELTPGMAVKKGQPLLELLPLLTPEGRANLAASKVDADGLVRNAESQREAAQIAFDRAMALLKDEAGSKRMVDEAKATLDLAQKALEAASARRDLLAKVMGDFDRGTASPVAIESPGDGILRNVAAVAGQSVPAGALLFEIVDADRVWLRVPVYVGDLSELDLKAAAAVAPLAAKVGEAAGTATPIPAPPSANSAAGSADLFYAFDNREAHYRPAQRVSVTIPRREAVETLTVPWSAVVHDIHGGTWVYEKVAEHTFSRRRVAVRAVVKDTALLAEGPKPGTTLVVAGAAELFGTETGFSK